jgi:hypothetical protein
MSTAWCRLVGSPPTAPNGGLFLDLVRQERPDLIIPEVVWTTGWVVSCKPAVQGTEKVLNDLGRDIHRIALTTPRLLAIDNGPVGFRYQDSQDQRWNTMTLPAHEFIRRLLPQVLPQGIHKVRDDGLWSPSHRPLLHQLQLCLARHAAGNRGLGPTPPRGSTLSILWSGPAGRHAFPAPTPTGATMSAPVASRHALFLLVTTRPADGSRPLVCPSLVNRPEASGATPPHWPQCPPNSRGSRPFLTAEDCRPSSNAPSKMLPRRLRQD